MIIATCSKNVSCRSGSVRKLFLAAPFKNYRLKSTNYPSVVKSQPSMIANYLPSVYPRSLLTGDVNKKNLSSLNKDNNINLSSNDSIPNLYNSRDSNRNSDSIGIDYNVNKKYVGFDLNTPNRTAFAQMSDYLSSELNKTTIQESKLSKFDSLMIHIFDFGIRPSLYTCRTIYNSIQDEIDFKYFIKILQMPDTIISWYFITAIHVWISIMSHELHPVHTPVISHRLTFLFMADCYRKIKEYHYNSTMISRRELAKHLILHFNGFSFDLDQAFSEGDLAVAEVLYLYSRQNEFDINFNSIMILIRYMRKQMSELESNDRNLLLDSGHIKWSSPDF